MAQAINDAIAAVAAMTDEQKAELAERSVELEQFRRFFAGEGRGIDDRLEALERRHREALEADAEKLTAA